MPDALQRTGRAVRELYEEHSQTLYRIAFTYLKNRYDAEDALQETFLRLIRGRVCFADETHEKAWLVRTVSNVCRDMLRARSRRHEDLDEHPELAAPEPEVTRDSAMRAFKALRAEARANGVSDMSLDAINDEIRLAREGRED